jgi:drug/metabolite transporter (DMT)-like permease
MAGAVGFATKGLFAKKLYAHGWTFEAVQVTRMALSLPVFWLWGWWRAGEELLRVERSALLGALGAGFLCYYIGSMLDFYALTMIDASLERVLLFSYPSMVVLAHSLLYRRWPDLRTLVALTATYMGIVAVVSGFDLAIFRANLQGAVLVLLCATTTATYFIASDRWTRRIGSVPFTVWAMTSAGLCMFVHAWLAPHARPPMPGKTDYLYLAGLVGFATVFAMLMTAEGVRRLGAQRAAVVSCVGPPATILFAVPWLGERMNLVQWAGVAGIVAGILVMELRRTGSAAPAPPPGNR